MKADDREVFIDLKKYGSDDFCGISADDGIRRHVLRHHRASGDHGIVPIWTPGMMLTPAPIQTLFPITTLRHFST